MVMIEFIEWLKQDDVNFWMTLFVVIVSTWSISAIGSAWRGK